MTGTGRFAARLVVPVDAPPIQDGVIEVTRGRITGLFPGPDATATDLGNVILVPGLVNAHTHLEFSTVATPLPATNGMAEWIGHVIDARRQQSDTVDSVRTGLDELVAAGTAAVGEITTSDWPAGRLNNSDPACVVFREIIGLRPDQHDDCLATAERFLAAGSTARCRRGLSPHAPYSVHPDLYTNLVRLAASHDVPLATHLAESTDELALLARGEGPMRERLEALGAWDATAIPRGSCPLDYLVPLQKLNHPLVIHGNLLDDREIAWLGRHPHVAIVYCPRTHAHFGHPPHPWRRLLDQGTPVVLGTDGRVSNPDLSMWNELQFLARANPDTSAEVLLAMATSTAATALGVNDSCGSLAVGKQATAIGLELPAGSALTLSSILTSGRPCGLLHHGDWHAH